MQTLANDVRAVRLMKSVIRDIALDLRDMTVLTEVGSGAFVVTPIIAAMAGAKVIAVTRDSPYGSATDVIGYGRHLAQRLGVAERIDFSAEPSIRFAPDADIVTNLGFVRPIDGVFISRMKSPSVISLMWEPWEFRDGDVDVEACRRHDRALVGTNESHPRVQTLSYLPLLAAKLAFECQIEVYGSRILVIASDPFGHAIQTGLTAMGADIRRIDPLRHDANLTEVVRQAAGDLDAVILAEHQARRPFISPEALDPVVLAREGAAILHICGAVDFAALTAAGASKIPAGDVPFGFMTVTTGYLGPRPVIDLHAAGLKVGELVVRSYRGGATTADAIAAAQIAGYALPLQ
jgi:hypothetical protein